jgi:hypothetical protein
MIDVVWACFVCNVAPLQSRVSFSGVVAGVGVGAVGVDEAAVVVE